MPSLITFFVQKYIILYTKADLRIVEFLLRVLHVRRGGFKCQRGGSFEGGEGTGDRWRGLPTQRIGADDPGFLTLDMAVPKA
jgi:hypothetical protein